MLHKTLYAGMFIFYWSKLLMYEFQYDYIRNKYGSNSRLLFTDTNTLIYDIKTEDFLKIVRKDKEIFDF